jgi:hypothetical protein
MTSKAVLLRRIAGGPEAQVIGGHVDALMKLFLSRGIDGGEAIGVLINGLMTAHHGQNPDGQEQLEDTLIHAVALMKQRRGITPEQLEAQVMAEAPRPIFRQAEAAESRWINDHLDAVFELMEGRRLTPSDGLLVLIDGIARYHDRIDDDGQAAIEDVIASLLERLRRRDA